MSPRSYATSPPINAHIILDIIFSYCKISMDISFHSFLTYIGRGERCDMSNNGFQGLHKLSPPHIDVSTLGTFHKKWTLKYCPQRMCTLFGVANMSTYIIGHGGIISWVSHSSDTSNECGTISSMPRIM